ncbi:MAG: Sjogren's syndrome/scleroderma autoantigen 1 family protein [Halapricum sp.]
MSDFDEEAERERLREQYEHEQQKREATERMSELLLKGATMTNAHCETCGDPLFRYEGQTFCPTCQEVVSDDGARTGTDSEGTANESPAASEEEGTSESTDANASGSEREQTTGAAGTAEPRSGEGRSDPTAEADRAEDTGAESESASDLPERRERARVPDRDRRPSDRLRRPDPPVRRGSADEGTPETPAPGEDLSAARESLRRSITRFAREAERADDPRRAREHLEAAHEAADALVSLSEIR